jgi:hypothetical protein
MVAQLQVSDQIRLQTAISRFRFIRNAARESKISIPDAEQSDHRQLAIEHIARVLSKE